VSHGVRMVLLWGGGGFHAAGPTSHALGVAAACAPTQLTSSCLAVPLQSLFNWGRGAAGSRMCVAEVHSIMMLFVVVVPWHSYGPRPHALVLQQVVHQTSPPCLLCRSSSTCEACRAAGCVLLRCTAS
jgi:hypothetical protein